MGCAQVEPFDRVGVLRAQVLGSAVVRISQILQHRSHLLQLQKQPPVTPPQRQRSRAPPTAVASPPLVSSRAYHQHSIPVLQHSWQSAPPCRLALLPTGHCTHAAICLSLSSRRTCTPAAPRVRQNEQHYNSHSRLSRCEQGPSSTEPYQIP